MKAVSKNGNVYIREFDLVFSENTPLEIPAEIVKDLLKYKEYLHFTDEVTETYPGNMEVSNTSINKTSKRK